MKSKVREMINEYKRERREGSEHFLPKAKKHKQFKVTAIFDFMGKSKRITVGRYATIRDAEKAVFAANKAGVYRDARIEEKDHSVSPSEDSGGE